MKQTKEGAFMYEIQFRNSTTFGIVMADNEVEAYALAEQYHNPNHIEAILYDHWYDRVLFMKYEGRIVRATRRVINGQYTVVPKETDGDL